ncbi:hypothetical protein IW261DRAFT_1454674 [Armillaria novae-zelandiae]|uniref:BTB domain-containing protein n=1 Tax=Armillaria novae-zelandiae TaxID=153914 RepID=A0AA39PL75_9AGAR|nr:hypothetical protein IW261DRAFT_1454674 [Armillaria novae-zelandiae]
MPMSSSPSRSQDYYWESIVLQVEDTLFRIPKQYLFGQSEAFDAMLSLPQGGHEPEGTSDERPIQLSGIKKTDFEQLLQVLHPIDATKQPELSINGWVSVLALASLWRMTVRKSAIKHLTTNISQISPADRIVLGRKYSVAGWISSGYEELTSRLEAVSLEEGERVGWSTALRIEHIRELNFKDRQRQVPESDGNAYYCGHCGYYRLCVEYASGLPFDLHTVKKRVGKLFKAELKDVEAEGAGFE